MSISGQINYLQEVGAGKAKYWLMAMMVTMMTMMMAMMMSGMVTMSGMMMMMAMQSGMAVMTISASLDWAPPAFTLLPHSPAHSCAN